MYIIFTGNTFSNIIMILKHIIEHTIIIKYLNIISNISYMVHYFFILKIQIINYCLNCLGISHCIKWFSISCDK